jgi:DNA recombination protein RmuC
VHFGQATRDVDDILVSTAKVTKRGQKIEALEFGDGPEPEAAPEPAKPKAADSKTGQLRLRVVDTDEP